MMVVFNQPNGLSSALPEPPENVACGQIVVTKGNPSRGKGYEISHFIRRNGSVRSASRFDIFLPSMRKATAWVRRHHPRAKLVARRKDHFGQLAALSYVCDIRDLVPISMGGRP